MTDNHGRDDDRSNDRDEDAPDPQMNQIARRGFDGVSLATENSATQALIAKATADIQARWVMAMRCPRNMDDVRQQLLRECKRPDFAQAAIYSVPRAGTQIRGLSIRFAEAAMSALGNMCAESQTLYDSDDVRQIRVTVTNFEGNSTWSRDVTIEKTKEVKKLARGQRPLRSRPNSFGDTIFIVEATPDDVRTREASEISKASRTGILRLVPAWLRAECMRKCDAVMADAAAKDPDAEKRAILDAFAEINVLPSWIAAWLGHPLEQSVPVELVALRKLFAALRSGDVTLDEAMEGAEDTRDRLKREAAAESKATAAAKTAANGQQGAGPGPAQGAQQNGPQGPAAQGAQGGPARGPAGKGQATGPAPAQDRRTGGRGAEAVKAKIAGKPDVEAKTTPEPSPDIKPEPQTDPGAQQALPVYGDPELEVVACDMCGVEVEVPKTDPPTKGRCEACRNS